MDATFDSIDENCDLAIARVTYTADGEEKFFFDKMSSLQVLRELPVDTSILVPDIFSERHRIFQKINAIKSSKNVQELLDTVLPLVENGNFPCKNISIIIDGQIKLISQEDIAVYLVSSNRPKLHDLIRRILIRQRFDIRVLADIVGRPEVYHKLEPPNGIVGSYFSFAEVPDKG